MEGEPGRLQSMGSQSRTQLNDFTFFLYGFPGGSMVKNPPANAGDAGSIPGSGRAPGEGNGNPLQYSCLGNPKDRGAWRPADYGLQERFIALVTMNSTTLT